MGTLLAVTVREERGRAEPAAIDAAFGIARCCESIMSGTDTRSELSRLNRRSGTAGGIVSPELARIVRAAGRLAEATDGAFDPTVGALVSLWHRAARRGEPPSPAALARVCARVGWRGIVVDGPRVGLVPRGLRLDLGAFGKGVALDRIARVLARRGASGILNFGESSLRTVGPPARRGWLVMLRHPVEGFAGRFTVRHGACSTSATFGQCLRVRDRLIGHVFDPRSGTSVRRDAQVTVLAASAAVAEAVSTALLVLGPSAIERIAERLGVAVCWIDRTGLRTTPGFVVEAA
jgi:thiamine biosynthesis lipoprotein